MKKSFTYPIVFMSALTFVFVLVLSLLNSSTADVIAFNERVEMQKKILYVFDIEYDGSYPEKINSTFIDYIREEKSPEGEVIYIATKDDQIIGRAYPVGGAGLWGSIEAYVGLSEDKSRILGLDFISQEETPGLGGRIDEKIFKDQFRGIEIDGNREIVSYRPASDGNLDSIAGATLTSQAVADFLNLDIVRILGGVK